MATQFNDMALGGSGFAAGYTPIRFAPLVSLTGPIQGPATPTAPEAAAPQAPMIRPPMVDESGSYEFANTFTGEPIGTRMATPAGRQAELANLANAAGFLTAPFVSMANYVLTGQSPAQFFNVGDWRTAQGVPQGTEPRGIVPPGGIQELLTGARNLLFGPQREPVSLAEVQGGPSAQTLGMAAESATNIANMYGLSPEQAAQVGQTAAGLVAQGMNMTEAITLATNYGAYAARPDVGQSAAISAPQTMAQSMLGGTGQAFGGYTQGGWDDPDRLVESSYDFGGGNVADNSGISYDISDFGPR